MFGFHQLDRDFAVGFCRYWIARKSLSEEVAWQRGYGRYKYCGLREDPSGKPPEWQVLQTVAC